MMRFLLFIGTVQSILFLGHWFLYRTFISFYGITHPSKRWIFRILLAGLSMSLILSSFLSFHYSNFFIRNLYTASVSWLGIFYLLVLASILSWALYGLMKFFGLSLDRKAGITILIGMALLLSLYGFWNAGNIRIQTISLPIPNLPDSWKGKRALWVSDLHLGQVRNHRFAQSIADRILALRPDIVWFGGDLFDGGEAMDLNHMVEPFLRLSPPHGSYFVTGNHEEFYDSAPYLHAVRRAGIRVLENEKIELDGLQIIGVGYRDSRGQDRFRSLLRRISIDRSKPSILLKHALYDLDIAREQGISAQISGHTHQGQLFLFRFITSWIYKGYDYGLKRWGDLIVYTSSGVGTWGPPMRIDTVPEIVVITFTQSH